MAETPRGGSGSARKGASRTRPDQREGGALTEVEFATARLRITGAVDPAVIAAVTAPLAGRPA
jgi:hypothetical protein